MRKKYYKSASRKYEALSKTYAGTAYEAKIDERIILIFEKRYKSHKTGIAMQKVLIRYQDKYSNNGVKKTLDRISKNHRNLFNKHFQKGMHSNNSKNISNSAIKSA